MQEVDLSSASANTAVIWALGIQAISQELVFFL